MDEGDNTVLRQLLRGLPATAVDADLDGRGALPGEVGAFQRVFDESPVGNAIISPDEHLRLTRVNPAFAAMLGYEPDELVGRSLLELSHPDDLVQELAYGQQLLSGELSHYRIEKRMFHKDGSTVVCRATGSLVCDERGDPLYGIGMIEDITDLAEAHETIKQQKARLDLTLEAASMSTWEIDLATGALSVSHNAGAVYGFGDVPTPATLDGLKSFVHPADLHVFDITAPEAPGDGDRFTVDFRVLIPGREPAWMRQVGAFVRDADGKAVAIRGMTVDATERRANEAVLAEKALTDELTGLPNRARLFARLAEALGRIEAGEEHLLAVLFIDLDRFKVVNDSMGHGRGDELLVQVSRRLEGAVRRSTTVARFGGDEFVVLCEGLDRVHDAVEVARRLCSVMEDPITIRGRPFQVGLSIGVAPVVDAGVDPEQVVRGADAAMYRAKQKGGGRYELFDEQMRAEVMGRMQLEEDLRAGLAADAIVTYFQPVVTLDGRVTGFEALARWQHPERGVVPPDEFIPVAEETGLITAIGRTVLHQACRQLASWKRQRSDAGGWTVAVNLSSHQLTQAGVVEEVRGALESNGLSPADLRLELTESSLVADTPDVDAAVAGLRQLGVRLSVDDFGTGYSSLLYLRRFPVDVVKVDRHFVAGLGDNDVDQAIVGSMIGLAHSLGMQAVAEGVETLTQLEVLRRLGCDGAQGYFWSPPEPAAVIESQVLNRSAGGADMAIVRGGLSSVRVA